MASYNFFFSVMKMNGSKYLDLKKIYLDAEYQLIIYFSLPGTRSVETFLSTLIILLNKNG